MDEIIYTKDQLINFCIDEIFKNNDIKYLHCFDDFELEHQEILVEFKDNNVSVLKTHPFQDNVRLSFLRKLLEASIKQFNLKLNCRIIFHTGEHANNSQNYTRLAFSSNTETNHIMIPDPHIFNQITTHKHNMASDIPFEQKENKIVFLGSDTGKEYQEKPINQRTQFCLNAVNHPKVIAKITQFTHLNKKLYDFMGINTDSIYSPYVTIPEQLRYKYILNIDGNSSSWDRIPWAMASNSLLFHLQSNVCDSYNWYYPFIIKENILPILDDIQILGGQFELDDYLKYKPKQKSLANLILNSEVQIEYFARVLEKYNNLYNNKKGVALESTK